MGPAFKQASTGAYVSNKFWVAAFFSASLLVNSKPASAQQGGFPDLGHIGPSKAEVIGVIVGAAAVIGVVVYLAIPKQKTIEGCIESSDGGLRLTTHKDKRVYVLEAGSTVKLQAGQRVVLKGKPHKQHGTRVFEVRKLTKEEGVCQAGGNSQDAELLR